MSTAGRNAIFLSYASQDAESARRICEALRTAGVEVWFDQSELRGGDAWDAKIRKQIKECALFVPVISANTQARREGYFRLEWKLADDRTHLMAKGTPFIVPVCIDDTKDWDALVPDSFTIVQWTRLSAGETPPSFCDRIKALLGQPPAAETEVRRAVATAGSHPPKFRSRGRRFAFSAVILVSAVAAGWLLKRWTASVPGAGVKTAGSSPPMAEVKSVLPGPTVSDKSIAVLPFANLSDDQDNTAFFSDGIHEDILTNLSNIRELRVVSRTSVMGYRNTTKKMAQIGNELGVTFILEGSVRRTGNRVRVTGQLIRAATDQHLWARNFTRELTDVFAIQSELSNAIAVELRAALSPAEKSLIDRRPTQNPAAYELVLKAHAIGQMPRGRQELAEQIALLRSAVELDPSYAEAHADLGYAYAYAVFVGRYGTPVQDDLANAKKAMDAAIRLAPDSPEVMRALGDYYYYGHRDYQRAMDEYQKVVQLRPNDAPVFNRIASVQRRRGQWVDAIANFRRAKELDPADLTNVGGLVVTLSAGRRYSEAHQEWGNHTDRVPDNVFYRYEVGLNAFCASGSTRLMEEILNRLSSEQLNSTQGVAMRKLWALRSGNLEEAVRLDEGASPDGGATSEAIEMAAALAVLGRNDAVKARLGNRPTRVRDSISRDPSSRVAWANLAMVEALLGNKGEALRCAQQAVDLATASPDPVIDPQYRAARAFVLTWIGDKDAAIAEYAQLLQTPFGNMRMNALDTGVHVMKADPRYAPLRGDPRFEALLNDPKNNAPLF